MLPEAVKSNVRHPSYWERPYPQWRINSWDDFYFEKYPNTSRRNSHTSLGSELEALISNLEPKNEGI
jgi:hypothetical protein